VAAESTHLPDALIWRVEARELLGDIHRLPDRQRDVLVLNALDGLSHEEVAVRLDTTVDTTRSLLARARENLRRTAAARETACGQVRMALDEAASGGVRASEIARRHLWTCAGCRSHQADLRTQPSRLRRLAGWSPWGVLAQLLGGGGVATVQKVAVGACCAVVVGGSAITVPVVTEHHRSAPEPIASAPVPAVPTWDRPARRRDDAPKPRLVSATPTPAAALAAATPKAAAAAGTEAKAKAKPRSSRGRKVRATRYKRLPDHVRYAAIMRGFLRSNPTEAQRAEVFKLAKRYATSRPGSRARMSALLALQNAAFKPRPRTPPPPKGIVVPAATPTATPTPTPTPTPIATPTPPVETPVPTPVATPTPPPVETPVATP